jgi:hypothetical protein
VYSGLQFTRISEFIHPFAHLFQITDRPNVSITFTAKVGPVCVRTVNELKRNAVLKIPNKVLENYVTLN